MEQSWHSSKAFNDIVQNYHNKYARQPSLKDVKQELEHLKKEMWEQMDKQGLFKCMGFSHKGSSYEGVKIISSKSVCPEFDLDFKIRGGEFLQACSPDPTNTWYELKVKPNKSHEMTPGSLLGKSQEQGLISPEKVLQMFHGSLSKCDFIRQYNVKLRYHGPAVQLDVPYPESQTLWFQVDLAPAFYLEGRNPEDKYSECFIAKSPDDKNTWRKCWYRSYSSDEKKLMDKAEGQRKVVLRTLKAMRGNSSQLSALTSYHLKMIFFEILEKFPDNSDWSSDKTGQRLIDMLMHTQSCLEAGTISNYFNKNINLLKLGTDAQSNLKNLILKLTTNEIKMFSFLNTEK